MWEIKYRRVSEENADYLKDVLKTKYSSYFDTIISIEQVDEAEVNSNNFKVKAEKNGNQVVYLLRRISNNTSRHQAERSCEIMESLAREGVKTPHVLSSDKNEIIVESDKDKFILFEFISGNHYRGTEEELRDAGSSIGALDKKLYQLTARYKDDEALPFSNEEKKIREFSIPIWEDIFEKAEIHSKKENEGSFGAQLLRHRDEIISFATGFKTMNVENFQLVHFDLHPHNLLTDGKKLLAIIDFDSVRYLEKMRAVSYALHRLVRQNIVFNKSSDFPSEVKRLKNIFIEAYRTQNSLSEEEVKSIPYFIKHESFSRLTNTMKDYANTGSLKWKHDLAKQLSNLKEAEFFK